MTTNQFALEECDFPYSEMFDVCYSHLIFDMAGIFLLVSVAKDRKYIIDIRRDDKLFPNDGVI